MAVVSVNSIDTWEKFLRSGEYHTNFMSDSGDLIKDIKLMTEIVFKIGIDSSAINPINLHINSTEKAVILRIHSQFHRISSKNKEETW